MVSILDDDADITLLFRDALQSVPAITLFTFTDPIMALELFMFNKEKYVLVNPI